MHVSGPSGGIAAYRMLQGLNPARPASPASPASPAAPAAPASAAKPTVGTLAAGLEGVPAGSDPALWSVLTTQEREFFQRQAALGPVVYGPGGGAGAQRPAAAAALGAPIGQRLDVRG